MSGPYEVGQTVEVAFTLSSTATTNVAAATASLVVTTPSGTDLAYSSTALTQSTPSSDSTSLGVCRWARMVPITEAGRWRYQFRSTGTILAAAGNAFAARGMFASTST